MHTKAVLIALLNLAIIHWSLCENKRWTNQHVLSMNKSACSKLNPVQSSRFKSNICPRTGAQIPVEQHCHFRLLCPRAWKQSPAWLTFLYSSLLWIDCKAMQTEFAAKMVANEELNLKAMQRPTFTGQASIFSSKIFFSNLLLKIIIYCDSNNKLILTIHP